MGGIAAWEFESWRDLTKKMGVGKGAYIYGAVPTYLPTLHNRHGSWARWGTAW